MRCLRTWWGSSARSFMSARIFSGRVHRDSGSRRQVKKNWHVHPCVARSRGKVRLRSACDSSGIGLLKKGPDVPVVIELTFPSSKSWVEVCWTVDDSRDGRVIELGLDLDLAIEGATTLVDFGADATVYGTIKGDEHLSLTCGGPAGWRVDKVVNGRTSAQAVSRDPNRRPEGWAHVMDATRCTAVALADIGHEKQDAIDVAANGRVRLVRTFHVRRGRKTTHAWFHFVGMPVQIGAATSPQSMQAPLEVVWDLTGAKSN